MHERTNIQLSRTDRSQLKAVVANRNSARVAPHPGFGATRNEIKWRPTVDVAAIQKEIDAVSQSYRLLDTRIQEANWLTDLIQT